MYFKSCLVLRVHAEPSDLHIYRAATSGARVVWMKCQFPVVFRDEGHQR
jgi:hypothetical protein